MPAEKRKRNNCTEAMVRALPMVSTRSGVADGIIADSEDSYLVPVDDVTALSSRLEELLQALALNIEMGGKARQMIERRYESQVAGHAFIDMWDCLIDGARDK